VAPERTLPQFLLLELKIIYFREPSVRELSGEDPILAEGFARLKRPTERKLCITKKTAPRVGGGAPPVGGMADPTQNISNLIR
jgi:hypothetical protein